MVSVLNYHPVTQQIYSKIKIMTDCNNLNAHFSFFKLLKKENLGTSDCENIIDFLLSSTISDVWKNVLDLIFLPGASKDQIISFLTTSKQGAIQQIEEHLKTIVEDGFDVSMMLELMFDKFLLDSEFVERVKCYLATPTMLQCASFKMYNGMYDCDKMHVPKFEQAPNMSVPNTIDNFRNSKFSKPVMRGSSQLVEQKSFHEIIGELQDCVESTPDPDAISYLQDFLACNDSSSSATMSETFDNFAEMITKFSDSNLLGYSLFR